jgi:hypothetical protein
LEELMASGNYEFQSDFAKKHQAQGRAEGEAKGEAKGCGLHVSDEVRARVLACTDVAQLDAWVRKAVTVTSVEELF